MKAYISGPMTGLPEYNFPAFFAMEERLRAHGCEVVNPATLAGENPGSATRESYLKRDYAALLDCDTIVMLPGWENSDGARTEITIARSLRMKVLDHQLFEEMDPRSAFRGTTGDSRSGQPFGTYRSGTGGEKLNVGKVRVELLPPEALIEVAKVLTYGANKYAANNWRRGLSWDFTLGSALRHILALMMGENEDPESGISHAAHGAAQMLFLTQFMATETGDDDRFATRPEES